MNWEILDTLICGIPTKWPNENHWVIRIYPSGNSGISYMSMGNVTPILEDWCENYFSEEYEVRLRFNSGDPYWSLDLRDEGDVSTFTLFWQGRIR
jgi:hypothetical protein